MFHEKLIRIDLRKTFIQKKLERLARTIQSYLLEHEAEEIDWQLDIATVRIDTVNKRAKVEILEDIVF